MRSVAVRYILGSLGCEPALSSACPGWALCCKQSSVYAASARSTQQPCQRADAPSHCRTFTTTSSSSSSEAHKGHLSQRLREALITAVGGRASAAAATLEQHGHGESYHPTLPPEMVLYPESTAEVSKVLELCNAFGAPVSVDCLQQGRPLRLAACCGAHSS